jgi:hypothetical protein
VRREQQLQIEGRAYLAQARDMCRNGVRANNPQHALEDIAAAREALHEAAMRFAEQKKLDDAAYEDMPF